MQFWIKLKYIRCFFLMKWNVICMQKSDFHVLDLFCRASHVRASMHRITSLELLRTLMLCLVQLSKLRECKATDAEKLSQWEKVAKCNFKSNAHARPRMLKSFFLSERKLLNAILRVKLKYMKMFLSHEINVICIAEDRFSCVRAFLQSKSC